MKKTIRRILLEETQKNEFFELGLNITIKSLKKIFPFIVGWEEAKSKYSTNIKWYIEINLLIDLNKTLEYYNTELKDSYVKYPEFLQETFAYPFSFTRLQDELSYDKKYELYKEIITEIREIYRNLPNEWIARNFESEFEDNFKDIDINGFKVV